MLKAPRNLVVAVVVLCAVFGLCDVRADSSELQHRVTVVARPDGSVSVQSPVLIGQLAVQLRALGVRPTTIRANDPVAYTQLLSVIQALTMAGFDHIGLVAVGVKADPIPASIEVVIGADGQLSVDANGPLTGLTDTLRVMVPNPAETRVALGLDRETPLTEVSAIDDALRAAGITSVRIVQRVAAQMTPLADDISQPCGPAQTAQVAALVLPPLFVRVDASGSASVDGEKVLSPAGLGDTLLRRANGNTYVDVFVQGTPDTTYADLSRALRAVTEAGFRRIALLNDAAMPKSPASP